MRNWKHSRSGQSIIYFMMVLVALCMVLLWNVDLHRILHIKSRSTTAGDAAALAAARFQALSLNLVGELNIMQAVALCNNDPASVDAITNIQARLLFTGPMTALVAAQVAAKNNRIYGNDAFTDELTRHASDVDQYDTGTSAGMIFPEPYSGAWREYAAMIRAVAAERVAAAPDNARYYSDSTGGHILLGRGFYDAVAGRSWCWFHNNAPNLLVDYQNFFPCWWPGLPPPQHIAFANSEYFGLGLVPYTVQLRNITDVDDIVSAAAEQGIGEGLQDTTNLTHVTATWYTYGGDWGSWDAMDTQGSYPFPSVGPVYPQYNYAGADAAIRVLAGVDRVSPSPEGGNERDEITWTSAA